MGTSINPAPKESKPKHTHTQMSSTNETWLIWLGLGLLQRFGYRTFPNWCRQYRTSTAAAAAATIHRHKRNEIVHLTTNRAQAKTTAVAADIGRLHRTNAASTLSLLHSACARARCVFLCCCLFSGARVSAAMVRLCSGAHVLTALNSGRATFL